jgi:hypothetical protein
MRRQYAKAADQWAQGVSNRPHLAASRGWLHGDTLHEEIEGIPS